MPSAFGIFGVAARPGAGLYWTNGASGTIGRAEIHGRNPDPNFITNAGIPYGVAIGAPGSDQIYWANIGGAAAASGTIGRANTDGSSVDLNFITGLIAPVGVAVDAAHVYWTNGEGSLQSIGRANSTAPVSTRTSSPSPQLRRLRSHRRRRPRLLDEHGGAATGTIGRANLDGSGIDQNFITGANEPSGMAVDAAHLYWANGGFNAIGRANLDGSGIDQTFIMADNGPEAVAVDARGRDLRRPGGDDRRHGQVRHTAGDQRRRTRSPPGAETTRWAGSRLATGLRGGRG